MAILSVSTLIALLICLGLSALFLYALVLLIKALRKYLRGKPVR